VQRQPSPRPVDAIANTVRDVDRAGERKPDKLRAIIIKSRVVRRHDRIVFRHPLQLFCIRYPAGNNRIWIHRTRRPDIREHLVQVDCAVAAKFGLLERESRGLLGAKQRRAEVLQSEDGDAGAKDRDHCAREPASYSPISTVTTGSPSPYCYYLDVPVLGISHKLLLPAAAVLASRLNALHRNQYMQFDCHTAVKTSCSNERRSAFFRRSS